MQTIQFGKTGEEVSRLGLGCMRLPVIDGDDARIDEEAAIDLIRTAIDRGITYIDTAYPYHGGNSERVVGRALADGYRERVKLATKMPPWMIKEEEDLERIFSDQLEALGADHIDFYLIHALTDKRWKMAKEHEVLAFLMEKQKQGKIKHLGFSFHGEYPLFEEILNAHDWDFCQIQYNFMDRTYQAGERGLAMAAERGLAVVIMEPLRGGSLVRDLSDDILEAWEAGHAGWSPVSWAFRFLFDRPEVTVVLSGMSTTQQVEENAAIASEAPPHHLSAAERATIENVRSIYEEKIVVNCTNCQYCMPCPYGVNIPGAFIQLNNASMFEDVQAARFHYHILLTKHDRQASHCVSCGLCETKCPQHIPIREKLKEAIALLE